MFAFLALVFAASFVVLGVGSGGGVGDFLQDFFRDTGGGGGNGPSVDKARERVSKNPKDAAAWLALADALRDNDRQEESIGPLERYLALRPKDEDAISRLAALYLDKTRRLGADLDRIQLEELLVRSNSFNVPTESFLGKELANDPIAKAILEELNNRRGAAYSDFSAAGTKAVSAYKRLAALRPDDANLQVDLAITAQSVGDYRSALAAYRRYLKLVPDSPDAPEIRRRIKEIEQLLKGSVAPTGQ